MEFIVSIISILFTSGVFLSILFYKEEKRKKKEEAKQKEIETKDKRADFYEERLESVNKTVNTLNSTINTLTETINNNELTISDKTSKIRELNDLLLESQKENGELKLRVQKLTLWRCEQSNCINRRPPQPLIQGLKYEDDSND